MQITPSLLGSLSLEDNVSALLKTQEEGHEATPGHRHLQWRDPPTPRPLQMYIWKRSPLLSKTWDYLSGGSDENIWNLFYNTVSLFFLLFLVASLSLPCLIFLVLPPILYSFPSLVPIACLPTPHPQISDRTLLGEGNGTHSSTLAWKIPWVEKPGRLQSMGSQRVGHD